MNTEKPRRSAAVPGVRSAVFRGKRHIQKKMPCQDACAAGQTRNGWTVMAVADGVSSSPHSEEAAQAAVEAAVAFWETFNTCFTGEAELLSAMRAAMNYALMATDKLREAHPEAYSLETTLTIALAVPEQKALYYAFVGDGGLCLLSRDGRARMLEPPLRAGDGAVYALSEGPARWRLGSARLSDARAILLVTDGIADILRAQGENCAAAGLFVPSESDEDYREFCKRALSGKRFQAMDDDAAIMLYTVAEVAAPPWWDDPADGDDADEPAEAIAEDTQDTWADEPAQKAKADKPGAKGEPTGSFLSALKDAQRELGHAVSGLKSLINTRRRK